MRKGRLILIILLIVVVLVIGGVIAMRFLNGQIGFGAPEATAEPVTLYVDIVIAEQNIASGTEITEEMLTTMTIPADKQITGEYTDPNEIVGQFARMQIAQNLPIMEAMLSPTPGISTSPGSPWASQIPQNLTAIAIPINRLDLVAYAVRDNDFVNIIVSMLLVDVDASFQTILPNYTETIWGAGALPESLPVLTVGINPVLLNGAGDAAVQGRAELDTTLNGAIYVSPSESQRPRLVTQMIIQNVQVLHVGTFPLPGEEENQMPVQEETTPTPPAEAQQVVERPDVITLMVTPQDAVVLTYLINSGANITLTLRNPNDYDYEATTDAATLQYLLSQYNIPVPAKLPYATQPRIENLTDPFMPNDVVTYPAE